MGSELSSDFRVRNFLRLGLLTLGLLGVSLLGSRAANGQDRAAISAVADTRSEGAGLAANYPGDVEIEKNSSVVFVQNF